MARHRKHTKSTYAKVAAGTVALSASAIALAPTASAAPDSDWDRLAQCESGGNWQINTSNGYHGGLQFSPQTWNGHGGGEFAPVAYQASREQQIIVAERVLASQGWGAWPACSAALGLNSPATNRDHQAAPAPAPAPAPVAAPAEEAPADLLTQYNIEVPAEIRGLVDTALNEEAAVDAIYNAVTTELANHGIPVPAFVNDLYQDNRSDLVSFYASQRDYIESVVTNL